MIKEFGKIDFKKYISKILDFLFFLGVAIDLLLVLLIYIIRKAPVFFWTDNQITLGRLLLQEISGTYNYFLFRLFVPLSAIFILLSLFFWLSCRQDKTMAKNGLKGLVVGVVLAFLLFLLPSISSVKLHEINEYQSNSIMRQ